MLKWKSLVDSGCVASISSATFWEYAPVSYRKNVKMWRKPPNGQESSMKSCEPRLRVEAVLKRRGSSGSDVPDSEVGGTVHKSICSPLFK